MYGGPDINIFTTYGYAAEYAYGSNIKGLPYWESKVRIESWPKMPKYRGKLGEAPNRSVSVLYIKKKCRSIFG